MDPIPSLCEWAKKVDTVGQITAERWVFVAIIVFLIVVGIMCWKEAVK